MALRDGEGDRIPTWKEKKCMKKRWLYDLGGEGNEQTQATNSWELQSRHGRLLRVERFVDDKPKKPWWQRESIL